MGFFSGIKDAAFKANEDAHGARLLREFRDSIGKMGNMPSERSDEIIQRYVSKRAKIKPSMVNWTFDGILSMAKSLKDEARRVTDLNIIEGYALWMTSAWLESGVRTSDNAREVFTQLDELAKEHESIIDEASAKPIGQATSQDQASEVLFVAITNILDSLSDFRIKLNLKKLVMAELGEDHQMTIAAGIGGVAAVIAMEFKQDLYETFGLAIGILEKYGMPKNISSEGMSTGMREYSPDTKTHFGMTTWRGIEAMRKFRNGIDKELDCHYIMASDIDFDFPF